MTADQPVGTAPRSRPPMRTGSMRRARPVVSSVSINPPQTVAGPSAGSTRPAGSRVTVSTVEVDGMGEVRIEDRGAGIDPALLDKIFDPFFTTKDVGKGTGQGLAIAHSVIHQQHNGSIDFASTPGKGTTFTIRLPVTP